MAKTAKKKTTTQATQPIQPDRKGLTIKLQIAAAVLVPMLALGLWLNSKGFFS